MEKRPGCPSTYSAKNYDDMPDLDSTDEEQEEVDYLDVIFKMKGKVSDEVHPATNQDPFPTPAPILAPVVPATILGSNQGNYAWRRQPTTTVPKDPKVWYAIKANGSVHHRPRKSWCQGTNICNACKKYLDWMRNPEKNKNPHNSCYRKPKTN
jgi:hypothetical protein